MFSWNLPNFSIRSKSNQDGSSPIRSPHWNIKPNLPKKNVAEYSNLIEQMNRLKFIHFLLFVIVLSSCKNEAKTQRETIEGRIRQINGMIALFQKHIDSRGAAISNMSSLSPAKKEEYHYDSLIHVQELQIKATKAFQEQRDSLQAALNSLK